MSETCCVEKRELKRVIVNLEPSVPLVGLFTNLKTFDDDGRPKQKLGSKIFKLGALPLPRVHVDGRFSSVGNDSRTLVNVFGADVANVVFVDDLNFDEAAGDADSKVGNWRNELFLQTGYRCSHPVCISRRLQSDKRNLTSNGRVITEIGFQYGDLNPIASCICPAVIN
jgi:hypothetical protein